MNGDSVIGFVSKTKPSETVMLARPCPTLPLKNGHADVFYKDLYRLTQETMQAMITSALNEITLESLLDVQQSRRYPSCILTAVVNVVMNEHILIAIESNKVGDLLVLVDARAQELQDKLLLD